MKINTFLLFFAISIWSGAKEPSADRLEFCKPSIMKAAQKYVLTQAWFYSGPTSDNAPMLNNWTSDYTSPLKYRFSFANTPKEKLWVGCYYSQCGDEAC